MVFLSIASVSIHVPKHLNTLPSCIQVVDESESGCGLKCHSLSEAYRMSELPWVALTQAPFWERPCPRRKHVLRTRCWTWVAMTNQLRPQLNSQACKQQLLVHTCCIHIIMLVAEQTSTMRRRDTPASGIEQPQVNEFSGEVLHAQREQRF